MHQEKTEFSLFQSKLTHERMKWMLTKKILEIFTTRWIFEWCSFQVFIVLLNRSTKIFHKSGLVGWNIQIFYSASASLSPSIQVADCSMREIRVIEPFNRVHWNLIGDEVFPLRAEKSLLEVDNVSTICRPLIIFFPELSLYELLITSQTLSRLVNAVLIVCDWGEAFRFIRASVYKSLKKLIY